MRRPYNLRPEAIAAAVFSAVGVFHHGYRYEAVRCLCQVGHVPTMSKNSLCNRHFCASTTCSNHSETRNTLTDAHAKKLFALIFTLYSKTALFSVFGAAA
jgi:hypothetical protein